MKEGCDMVAQQEKRTQQAREEAMQACLQANRRVEVVITGTRKVQ